MGGRGSGGRVGFAVVCETLLTDIGVFAQIRCIGHARESKVIYYMQAGPVWLKYRESRVYFGVAFF